MKSSPVAKNALKATWASQGIDPWSRKTRMRSSWSVSASHFASAAARARGPADLSKVTVVRVGGTQEDAGAKEGVAAVTAAAEGE